MSTEIDPTSRAFAQKVAKSVWAKRIAKRDPMFLKVEALVWSTKTVWVQFRSMCPRCSVRCTLSFTSHVDLAYAYELREHIRWEWEEMLMEHVCLVKGWFHP